MKQALKDGLSYLLSVIAKAATPALERRLSEWSTSLFADVPAIGGAWVVSFREPLGVLSSNPQRIDAVVRQFGRRIEGAGHVQGEPGDPFQYRGRVKRNVLYGEFHRKNQRILAGTGTFILKIAADSRGMAGICTWFDSDLDEVWQSQYSWERKT